MDQRAASACRDDHAVDEGDNGAERGGIGGGGVAGGNCLQRQPRCQAACQCYAAAAACQQ